MPLINLACLHKHAGVREEREVRIVAIPDSASVRRQRHAKGDPYERKPIQIESLVGAEIPRIYLPELKSPDGPQLTPLPIKRVIIGPHHDREARRRLVHEWLIQHGIELSERDVVVSSIPFVTR